MLRLEAVTRNHQHGTRFFSMVGYNQIGKFSYVPQINELLVFFKHLYDVL